VKISLEHDIDRDELRRLADVLAGATFFHTPAWMDALAASFPHFRTRWLLARDGNELAGFMPFVETVKGPLRFYWALPFGTYGDPVAREPDITRALLQAYFAHADEAACLEASAYLLNHDCDDPFFERMDEVKREECRMIRLEGGFDDVWHHGFHHKRRQICNKAERERVTVRPLESEEEVDIFYKTYVEESREWGGVHPYPGRLFIELFRRRDEGVLIWGAFHEQRFIGGHIDMYHGSMAQAWQAGMSEESGHYGAGVLLIKYAVMKACERGMKTFNLGSSGGDEGIIYFKESLGGEEYCFPVVTSRKKWWGWIKKR